MAIPNACALVNIPNMYIHFLTFCEHFIYGYGCGVGLQYNDVNGGTMFT